MKGKKSGNLNLLRKEIQKIQLILIISITVLMSLGGAFINLNSMEKDFNQNLQNTSDLITRIYGFIRQYSQEEICSYMDNVVSELSEVDIISIVDKDLNRVYHTHHELINTKYDGTIPDFSIHTTRFYTENDIGPSGPQRRTYSAVYDQYGRYCGFIMTICLKTSMTTVSLRILSLFFFVTLFAILIEIMICFVISKKIKKEFLLFTEDFEGTKILVDSMRANNHDFTNKLHVILGLIQIGEYEKAASYIQSISMIQGQTIHSVMNSIENPSFAALIVGKIARASECDVKFILQDGICFRSRDIDVPSEALVTITGNLIDNALDEMNLKEHNFDEVKELIFGVYTKPGSLLITVKDSGGGIPKEIGNKIFEKGFSTKGSERGIGLYHTKQLVESMGGHISYESQEGRGTCFMVRLEK
ncbi:MAG: ATP-binding protein [Spirochaetales bacterium]|nr:ATP-binding protein [Spirochaetales bacterium]